MKSIGRATIAFAAAMAAAAPSFAQTFAILPPASESPSIATENQALSVLQSNGVSALRGLGLIGDYWETEGIYRGQPVVAYLYQDGRLDIRHYPESAMIQAFGGMPEIGSQVAAAP